ncbi:MAG: glutamine-hydrolyzing carbamoyl-phosphate synthase small subunit [Candidatus Omnitrophica bacterium]|nr:glutamine-hydrolyzing carbamoyl-phosphate synthase small subunit [Candidatus Omnitrophota bacterium]
MKALLMLEDGTCFEGQTFGASGTKTGEVVFNTSMSGYQEILTDPSYKGQIVAMTYPLIGNYGVNEEDVESHRPWVEGFLIREKSNLASNWRSTESLEDYLRQHDIPGIEGIDTRALTRHIRSAGAMKAVISTDEAISRDSLLTLVRKSDSLVGKDLVKEVTSDKPQCWNKKGAYKVVVLDCGVKYNILRELAKRNCEVYVAPAYSSAKDILGQKPHGVLLSNGPGDPAGVPYVVETVKGLVGKIPLFGICLGHQMLGLALGGKTFKLKFGHHGANHPVKDTTTGKIAITVQNHGFCVDVESLNDPDIEITHINLNDQTVEGLRHKKLPLFAVQFHPEASPGPNDAKYLFDEFINLMKQNNA